MLCAEILDSLRAELCPSVKAESNQEVRFPLLCPRSFLHGARTDQQLFLDVQSLSLSSHENAPPPGVTLPSPVSLIDVTTPLPATQPLPSYDFTTSLPNPPAFLLPPHFSSSDLVHPSPSASETDVWRLLGLSPLSAPALPLSSTAQHPQANSAPWPRTEPKAARAEGEEVEVTETAFPSFIPSMPLFEDWFSSNAPAFP
jgi:hypothetical protein